MSGSDSSDAAFSVVSGSASVSVTGPAGGALYIGNVVPVTWNHNLGMSARFTVEISRNGASGPWEVLGSSVPPLTPTTGRLDWTVAGATSSRVRFRVRPANFTVQGTSPSNLSIVNPTLTITSPSSGETWIIGRKVTFKWTTNLDSSQTIKVELTRDGGNTWLPVAGATAVAANAGRFTWTVTGPATSLMKARATWNQRPSVTSESSGINTIK